MAQNNNIIFNNVQPVSYSFFSHQNRISVGNEKTTRWKKKSHVPLYRLYGYYNAAIFTITINWLFVSERTMGTFYGEW